MLKKLTIISLFVLALPFFQTCSDKNIMENEYLQGSPLLEVVEPVVDSVVGEKIYHSSEKEFHYTSKELANKKRETVNKFLILKDNMTSNGYQLGFWFIQNLEFKDFFNSTDYESLVFFLILIISFLLLYFTFRNKVEIVLILSVLNLFLLLLYLVLGYLSGFLEDIHQIKYGYYLFIINLILISFEAYKLKKVL